MRIVSWNCRGLGNPSKFEAVKDLMKTEPTDILMLQETKIEGEALLEISKKQWQKNTGKAISARGSSGGIATLWKEDHNVRALVVIILSYLNKHDSAIGSMILFVHYIMQFHSFLSDWSIVIKVWNITLHVVSLLFMCIGIWMQQAHGSWPVQLGTEAPLLLRQQQRRNHGKRYIAVLYFVTRNQ